MSKPISNHLQIISRQVQLICGSREPASSLHIPPSSFRWQVSGLLVAEGEAKKVGEERVQATERPQRSPHTPLPYGWHTAQRPGLCWEHSISSFKDPGRGQPTGNQVESLRESELAPSRGSLQQQQRQPPPFRSLAQSPRGSISSHLPASSGLKFLHGFIILSLATPALFQCSLSERMAQPSTKTYKPESKRSFWIALSPPLTRANTRSILPTLLPKYPWNRPPTSLHLHCHCHHLGQSFQNLLPGPLPKPLRGSLHIHAGLSSNSLPTPQTDYHFKMAIIGSRLAHPVNNPKRSNTENPLGVAVRPRVH